jgi:glycosyltransferase involved in cell wall biosynthesis
MTNHKMEESRRVLLDVRPLQDGNAKRGIGSYVRGLIAGLLEQGFDRRTALLYDATVPLPPLPAGDWLAYRVRRRYGDRLGLIEEAAAMPADLRRIRPALYHATTLALPGRSPAPLVVTLHDLIPWLTGGWRMLGERSRWWLGRRLLRRADLVITPSEATARDARNVAEVEDERLVVIPEGVAPGFVPAEGARDRVVERHGLTKPYFVFVGALDARKDPSALLRAWETAKQAGADVDLVLAGAASRQAPADMGAARRLGYLEHTDLVDLYSAAIRLLFPSRYEGFGLPVLEAMACGCPVVTYRNSSLPEVAGDAAIMVADGDFEAMGRAAGEIALRPNLAARLRKAGLARAREFSWGKAAQATIAVYRRFLR